MREIMEKEIKSEWEKDNFLYLREHAQEMFIKYLIRIFDNNTFTLATEGEKVG